MTTLFWLKHNIYAQLSEKWSEGSRKTIINTIICWEIVEICVVYESVLKITEMENKIIFFKLLEALARYKKSLPKRHFASFLFIFDHKLNNIEL